VVALGVQVERGCALDNSASALRIGHTASERSAAWVFMGASVVLGWP
jgi:hypothetical protein